MQIKLIFLLKKYFLLINIFLITNNYKKIWKMILTNHFPWNKCGLMIEPISQTMRIIFA